MKGPTIGSAHVALAAEPHDGLGTENDVEHTVDAREVTRRGAIFAKSGDAAIGIDRRLVDRDDLRPCGVGEIATDDADITHPVDIGHRIVAIIANDAGGDEVGRTEKLLLGAARRVAVQWKGPRRAEHTVDELRTHGPDCIGPGAESNRETDDELVGKT